MTRRIDLHTHSNASDGTDSPRELIRRAKKLDLAAVALTDHDTLSGLDEAAEAGEEFGIELVRGVEVAAHTPHGEAHFLGLWLPSSAPGLEKALGDIRNGRALRNKRMLRKLAEGGMPLSMDDVLAEARGETVARPHIARALVKRGYVSSVQEVFATLLGENMPMYVPRAIPSPKDALAMLRAEGALTVFAHPMLLDAPLDWLDAFTAQLAEAGLDAIEAWHSEHDAAGVRFCVDLAARHGLALSGGSDYHGSCKPHVRLGSGRGNIRIPWSVLETLRGVLAERDGKGRERHRG